MVVCKSLIEMFIYWYIRVGPAREGGLDKPCVGSWWRGWYLNLKLAVNPWVFFFC